MPDQTNITDFNPATGRTTTTLVSAHNRGALEEATRDGGQHNTWHRNDFTPVPMPPPPGPTITSVTPSTGLNMQRHVVTITGTNFIAGTTTAYVDSSDGSHRVSEPPTIISPTQMTMAFTPDKAGLFAITVRTPGASPQYAYFNWTAT